MLKTKKIGLLLGFMIIFGSIPQYTRGLPNGQPKDHENQQRSQNQDRPSEAKIDNENISKDNPISSGNTTISKKSMGILQVPERTEYESRLGYVIALVQIAVNRTLGMLSLVTLIFMLYNGFLILTSGSDSKNAEKGKKGIKTATIAIAGIGLSRLIISIMIRLIKTLKVLNT